MFKLHRNLELHEIFWFIDVEDVPNESKPEFLIVSAFTALIVPLSDEIFDIHDENPSLSLL